MTTDSQTERAGTPIREAEGGRSFWLLLSIIVVAAAVLMMLQIRRPTPPDPWVGLPLPPLEVAGWINSDQPVTAKDLAGHVVLVDFWATWCGPCVAGLPELIEFRKKFRDSGVIVVGFTSEDGAAVENVKNFVQTRTGMDWPIAYGAGLSMQMMGITGIPTYILYDRSGKSVWRGHSLDGAEDATVATLAK